VGGRLVVFVVEVGFEWFVWLCSTFVGIVREEFEFVRFVLLVMFG